MIRVLLFALAVFAQDSTGVHLSSIPGGLPKKEAARLAKQKKLVEIAVDSIDAAIHRFNLRCAAVATAAALAACQAEMNELQAGGAELEKLKEAFNADVERTAAASQLPAQLGSKLSTFPPVARENVSAANAPATSEGRRKTRAIGGGKALDQLKSADESGMTAKEMEDGRDPAKDVFDRVGQKPDGDVVDGTQIGTRPRGIPESVKKDPRYRELESSRVKLAAEHARLEKDLAGIRRRRAAGEDHAGNLSVAESAIKQKLSNNEASAGDVRRRQDEIVDRSIQFGKKTDNPGRKEPREIQINPTSAH